MSYDFYGESRTHELKPGGKNIDVNYDNRKEYVDRYVEWKLNDSIEPFFTPLLTGFHSAVDTSLFCLLSAHEFYLLLCAEPDLDFEHLKDGTRYLLY